MTFLMCEIGVWIRFCLTIALLIQRFPEISSVSWAFLKFVAVTRFRYGVRSISHLIDLIPPSTDAIRTLGIRDLALPLNDVAALKDSSLAVHLIAEDGPAAVIETWRSLKTNEVRVRFRQARLALSLKKFLTYFRDASSGRIKSNKVSDSG